MKLKHSRACCRTTHVQTVYGFMATFILRHRCSRIIGILVSRLLMTYDMHARLYRCVWKFVTFWVSGVANAWLVFGDCIRTEKKLLYSPRRLPAEMWLCSHSDTSQLGMADVELQDTHACISAGKRPVEQFRVHSASPHGSISVLACTSGTRVLRKGCDYWKEIAGKTIMYPSVRILN